MTAPEDRAGPPIGEFVARTAMMISLVALSIDAMLPALQEIGGDLGAQRRNDAQLVISALFLGLAVGTMVYGPVSDSTGRRPPSCNSRPCFLTASPSLSVIRAPSIREARI